MVGAACKFIVHSSMSFFTTRSFMNKIEADALYVSGYPLIPYEYCFPEIRPCMNESESQAWYQLYASAVAELAPERLTERVNATEAAIHSRLRYLQYDSDHHEERQLMADAQHTLALLRRLSLNDAALGRRPNSDDPR